MGVTLEDLRMVATPARTGAMAEYPYSPSLEERFTVQSRFGDVVKLYTLNEAEGMIGVPRALCPLGVEDARVDGRDIQIVSKVQPKNEEQARIIRVARKHLLDGRSFIIEAATGIGKTVISCDLIATVKKTALIIVTKQDLMWQWHAELLRHTTLGPDDIGLIQQNKMEVKGKSVCIGLVHSLAIPDRYPEWIHDAFGLVIWDEVHRTAADTFSRTVQMFTSKLRLGLSATPTRSDAKEFVFEANIGPVLVSSQKADLVPTTVYQLTKWKCPIWSIDGEMRKMPHTANRMGGVINSLVADEERNLMIVTMIRHAYSRDRKIVVFSDRVEHLTALREAVVAAGIPNAHAAMYVGKMKKAALQAATLARVIFTTYGMMTEGTDIPTLDTCVLATPRANVKQVVGRILRLADKKPPFVVDFVDLDSPVLKQFWKSRQKYYASVSAELKQIAS